MSAVFDARNINGKMSGIERYSVGLLSGIAELDPSGKKIFVLTNIKGAHNEKFGRSNCFEFIYCNSPPWSPLSQIKIPRLIKKIDCKIYHCPDLFAPLLSNTAVLLTLHDLIPFRCRSMLKNSKKSKLFPLWKTWVKFQCKQADAIVTVSNFSKNDILDLMKIPSEKVRIIYNGVLTGQVGVSTEEFRKKFGFPRDGKIISYIGRHDPTKNIVTLIEAFNILLKKSNRDLYLVIGGSLDPRYPEALRRTEHLGLGRRVVFTDYIDDPWRIALLKNSSVFVFPSLYEGFGIPPLEALYEGIPVVASNTTSLPEVLQNAALLVDPRRPEALADAIFEVLENEHLRHSLIKKGHERVGHFSWKRSAQQHLELYDVLARMSI